jgi:hypothetical protein
VRIAPKVSGAAETVTLEVTADARSPVSDCDHLSVTVSKRNDSRQQGTVLSRTEQAGDDPPTKQRTM